MEHLDWAKLKRFVASESPMIQKLVADAEKQRSFELLETAAALGSSHSATFTGTCYRCGFGVTVNVNKAQEYYKRAIALGDAHGYFAMGDLYYVQKNYVKAAEWFQKGVDAGDPEAMANLGNMYRNGEGVTRNYEKAREYYEMGLALGELNTITNLGILYVLGQGVAKDYQEALALFERAGDFRPALKSIGYMYEHGYGVKKDRLKALGFYNRAGAVEYIRFIELYLSLLPLQAAMEALL